MDRLEHRRARVDQHVREAVGDRARHLLADVVDGRGVAPEGRLLLVGVGRVRRGRDPLRRPLEEPQLGDLVDDGRDDLDRARARPDDADPLSRDRHVVIPARAVEAWAAERPEPLDVRVRWMMEHAGRGDDEVGHVRRAVGVGEVPAPALEDTPPDLLAVADLRVDAIAPRDVLEVGPYLRAGREPVRPFRIEREGVAVEVRRDVARESRVRVLAPRPPEPVGLLVDRDVVEAGLAELDRREDAGHDGTDHDDAHVATGGYGAPPRPLPRSPQRNMTQPTRSASAVTLRLAVTRASLAAEAP